MSWFTEEPGRPASLQILPRIEPTPHPQNHLIGGQIKKAVATMTLGRHHAEGIAARAASHPHMTSCSLFQPSEHVTRGLRSSGACDGRRHCRSKGQELNEHPRRDTSTRSTSKVADV